MELNRELGKQIYSGVKKIRIEITGVLLLSVWFLTQFNPILRIVTSLLIFVYLMFETSFLISKRERRISELPSILVFTVPIFAVITLVSFFIVQYLLGYSQVVTVIVVTGGISLAAIPLRLFMIRKDGQTDNANLLSPSKSPILNLFLFFAGIIIFTLTYYHFTYLGNSNMFLMGDETNYLAAIQSFARGGGSIVNLGSSLVGQANFVYTSSTMTIEAFLLGLFGDSILPVNFLILMTGIFGALFFYFSISLTHFIRTTEYKIVFAIISLGGFSLIGAIWLINSYSNALSFISTPLFFQGVPFRMVSTGLIHIEPVENEIFFKAIWHGLPFLTALQSLYFLRIGKKNSFLLYVLLTVVEYYPLGIALLTFYVLFILLRKFKLLKYKDFLIYVIPLMFFSYLLLEIVGLTQFKIPYLNITVHLNNASNLSSEVVSLAILTSFLLFFLWLITILGYRLSGKLNEVSYAAFLITVSGFLLIVTTVNLSSGVAEGYLFGFILTLSCLFVLLDLIKSFESGTLDVTHQKGTVRSLSRKTKTTILLLTFLLISPTLLYIEQPASNVLKINENGGSLVNLSITSASRWLTENTPSNSVILTPLNLWYVAPLSNRQILTSVYERPISTYDSSVYFNEMFYAGSFSLNFSNQRTLNELYNAQGQGNFTFVSNTSISASKVLKVERETYSEVNFDPQYSLPASKTTMEFSVFPTSTVRQPNDVLGVIITLSNGLRISFQNNSNIQSNLLVVPISLYAMEWNNLSFNLSNILSENDLNPNLLITSISLQGGTSEVIYWGNFALHPSVTYTLSDLVKRLSQLNINYIIATEHNAYLQELIRHGYTSLSYNELGVSIFKFQNS